MNDPEHWRELCEQAAKEQNSERLLKLIAEIDRLLLEKQTRLKNKNNSDNHPQRASNKTSLFLEESVSRHGSTAENSCGEEGPGSASRNGSHRNRGRSSATPSTPRAPGRQFPANETFHPFLPGRRKLAPPRRALRIAVLRAPLIAPKSSALRMRADSYRCTASAIDFLQEANTYAKFRGKVQDSPTGERAKRLHTLRHE